MEATLDYRIYKHYTIENKIGKGSYGQVFKAKDNKTHRTLAIKKLIDAFQNITDAKRTYRQLAYLLQLSHPSIIGLERVLTINKPSSPKTHINTNVYAVFQFMEFDLAKTIHSMSLQSRTLELIQRKYISMQLLSAIEFLQNCGLVHRDIKPSNILVNTSCDVKLCDFGLVRMICQTDHEDDSVYTEYVASRWYRAPEVMINGNSSCSSKIDMWSVACVIAQLILNQPLFPGKSTIDQLEKIFSLIGMPTNSQIENLQSEQGKFLLKNFQHVPKKDMRNIFHNAADNEVDLIMKILKFDPDKRLSIKQALNHSYFDDVRDIVDNFKAVPVKIIDHSIPKKNATLEDYHALIEGLCVDTYRETNSSVVVKRSQKSDEVWFQQKSTRQSNCGRINHHQKDYVINETIKPKEQTISVKKNTKAGSLTRKRTKSAQKSRKMMNSSKHSSNSSKSQLKIKPTQKVSKPPSIESLHLKKPSQLKKKKKDKFSTTNLNRFLTTLNKK